MFICSVCSYVHVTYRYLRRDNLNNNDNSNDVDKRSIDFFFQFMDDLLSMGPPVYFIVTPGLNYSNRVEQNIICGGQGCNSDSLYTQIYSASKQPAVFV